MKSIHDLKDSFSDKSLWLSINHPCLIREMYVFTLVRKRGVVCAVNFTYTKSFLDIQTWNILVSGFCNFPILSAHSFLQSY